MSKVFSFWPSNQKPPEPLQDHEKYSTLQELVRENNAELIKKFLDDEKHLDLNFDEDNSTPPLSIAASLGNTEVVELLCNFILFIFNFLLTLFYTVTRNPKIDFVDNYGLTALMYASKLPSNSGLSIVHFLLSKMAELNISVPEESQGSRLSLRERFHLYLRLKSSGEGFERQNEDDLIFDKLN